MLTSQNNCIKENKRQKVSDREDCLSTTSDFKMLEYDSSGGFALKDLRSKRAKTEEELQFLEKQFQRDPTWNRETVQICKKALNLKTAQIYKWGYDKKKNLKKRGKKEVSKNLQKIQEFSSGTRTGHQ